MLGNLPYALFTLSSPKGDYHQQGGMGRAVVSDCPFEMDDRLAPSVSHWRGVSLEHLIPEASTEFCDNHKSYHQKVCK